MQVRLMFFAVGILVLIGLLTPSMHAQVLYGSVVGTVQDQSGAVIPGANVTLTSAGTGQTREITKIGRAHV